LQYNCHKIFYTGENVRPNFRECDFAISFDWDDYGGKNLRLPLFRWSPSLTKLYNRPAPAEILSAKSKFCCMVVSNGSGKERNAFYRQLSQYKKVDSGGRFLNNIGYVVPDKVTFAKDYKFIIAFENSCYPGYTTEKIFQPMLVDCLPIYWGNPAIGKDFNPKSFINVHNYRTYEDVIEQIIGLDTDDDLYCSYLEQPYFTGNKMPERLEIDYLSMELKRVIDSLEHSVPVCRQVSNRVYEQAHMCKKKFLSRLYGKQHWYC
jgi:alpha(1,3/1,4) fucosyltransferase